MVYVWLCVCVCGCVCVCVVVCAVFGEVCVLCVKWFYFLNCLHLNSFYALSIRILIRAVQCMWSSPNVQASNPVIFVKALG